MLPPAACWPRGVIRSSFSTTRRDAREGSPSRSLPARTTAGRDRPARRCGAGGFLRGRGNTVWWASADPRIETFRLRALALRRDKSARSARRHLSASAIRCSARISIACCSTAPRLPARACRPTRESGTSRLGNNSQRSTTTTRAGSRVAGRLVLDCSGRAGVVARRFRRVQPGHRTTRWSACGSATRGTFPTTRTRSSRRSRTDGPGRCPSPRPFGTSV